MEGVYSAAIEALLQNLINLVNLFKDESPLLRGLDEDAQQLQGTLETIQAYLIDAENKSITQNDVQIWLRDLEAAAFVADNALDELSYHLLHKKVYKMKSSKDKVLSCFSSLDRFLRGRNMARTIKQINATFESMNRKATDLGLQSMVVDAPAVVANTSIATDSFCHDPIFVGRDDDVVYLVEMLTHIPQDQTFSIAALVGMGGMGKTTLTRKVFNHERVKARFKSLIWIHVSQTFDPITLFMKILSTLTFPSYGGDEDPSKEAIQIKLQEALKARTYLLVLDDVWNEDDLLWKEFMHCMVAVTSTVGNGIIITTRSQRVASVLSPLEYTLSGLSNDDCWSIITAKAFDGNEEIPSEFEIIGNKIAEACRGFPLAANVVGGMLRGKSEEEWRLINENCLSDAEGGEIVSKILKLSFDHLSSPSLKKCFVFCSIFSRGMIIDKQELIELWMLKGLIQPGPRDVMECVGNMFFNVLLHNSLLQVVSTDYHGNVPKCVMHDLVHDVASSVLSNNTDGVTPVRYMFLEKESGRVPKNVAKHLRILFLECGISDIEFSNFECLHNLTLKGDYKELPCSIRELVHLRNLNILDTEILNLPEWFGELYHLQALRACRKLEKLPSTLKHMFNLRHLHIDSNTKLPAEIGRLTSLQTLPYFKVGKEKGYQIEELGSLKNLKGTLEIHNLEMVRDKKQALKANIFEKSNLSELVLRWEASKEGERNDKDVLKGLQPLKNANLQKLTISGFQGKRFPASGWMEFDSSLTGLIEITLSSCQELEEIPTLGYLPNLKSLSLSKLSNVRSINSSFYGSGNSENVVFPALESILLLNMVELNEWKLKLSDEVKVFPRLKSLKMYHCYKLECLPDWLFDNTHHLTELDIRHCPKLRELPDGLHALNDLEQMIIRGCRNLKSMGNSSGGRGLTSLRSLEIHDCQALTKIVEPSANLLRKVCVRELRSLQNLPEFLDCLVESTLLEQLTVVAVPEVTSSTSSVEVWPFHRLKKLEIDVNRQWSKENNEAIKVRVDGILKNCRSSLGELSLTGLEIWECLPDSVQGFTALSSLKLKNFGVKALPEWSGGLSSLKRLYLSDCANLRGLPSMQSLTKLQVLHIRDCPQLRIESERHKILNRVRIYVNGHKL